MINGIININKESGYTSHDVVAKLRGITKQKKIGHTGTLDPDARGVLPICFGKATKVCDLLTNQDKIYVTTLLLGKTSDTQDISGKILSKQDTSFLTKEMVKECIQSFQGESKQIPPMYSAIKFKGKKLYELAREGIEVERKSRKIFIHHINILATDIPRVKIEIKCSKGTYIRTICHDIGEKLGCGGLMEDLLRTEVGQFNLSESITIDEFREVFLAGKLEQVLLKIDSVFMSYPKVYVKRGYEVTAYNGNILTSQMFMSEGELQSEHPIDVTSEVISTEDRVRLYDCFQNFIGIYRVIRSAKEREKLKVEKMFYDAG